MWKRPSIEKPDFKKFEFDQMSEKETGEVNGGSSIIEVPLTIPTILNVKYPPHLSGFVAESFPLTPNK